MARAKSLPDVVNVRDLIAHLGDIPPERIRMHPLPGTATEKDLLRLIERDRILCELIDGVLVDKSAQGRWYPLGLWIGFHIEKFLTQFDLGATFGGLAPIRLRVGLVRVPDTAYVRWEKMPGHCYPDEPIPDLVPDLAVEMFDESNTLAEMRLKRLDYFRAGASIVWEVDHRTRSVIVFRQTNAEEGTTLTEADTLDGGDVLPGFLLPVAAVFQRIRRKGA